MHLVIATRGLRDEVRKWIEKLSSISIPFKVHGEGKDSGHELPKGDYQFPLAIRPIQLWDFCFPEESQDAILNTIIGRRVSSKGVTAATINKKNQKWVSILQMGLGLEKIPEFDRTKQYPIPDPPGTEVVAIGLKRDYRFADGTEGL